MAEIRFNYGDKFTQTSDSNTGIGSTNPAAKLDVAGGTSAGSLRVSGIATLSSYQGFVNTKLSTTENLIVEAGQSGSVSGEVVIGTGQTISVSTGATTGQGGIQSLKVYETFMPPVGGTADRPTDVKPGMVYYNKDFKTIEFWDGNFWKQVDNISGGGRGYIAGGYDGSAAIKTIDLIQVSTLGNAVDFGESTVSNMRNNAGRASSRIEGFTMSTGSDATILVFTLSTTGNAVGFAEQTYSGAQAALASSTRALASEGSTSSKTVDYIEMSTKANAIDFGDLTVGRNELGAVSSATRGIFCGGGAPSGSGPKSIMDFFTIASKGNAATFGDLTNTRGQMGGGVSDGVRGVVAGGYGSPLYKKGIDYMTIASTGNAIRFGDLMIPRAEQAGATCNRVRGLFCGGATPSSPNRTNSMEFVTIASTGNGQDFGDLTQPRDRVGGGCISDSHGGLGGF